MLQVNHLRLSVRRPYTVARLWFSHFGKHLSISFILIFLATLTAGAQVSVAFDATATIPTINSSYNDCDIVIYGNNTNISIGAGATPINVDGFKGKIILDNVDYRKPGGGGNYNVNGGLSNFMNIHGGSDVKLLLKGESDWRYSDDGAHYGAGLRVEEGSSLTIEAYNGVDAGNSLTVIQSTPVGGAAIGTNYLRNNSNPADAGKWSAGNITINSGTVTAIGGDDAAGIGGSTYGAGGYITINGGDVYARCNSVKGGGNSGAGIGAGSSPYNNHTYIMITGGKVDAHSALPNGPTANPNLVCGAAIGAGNPIGGYANPVQGSFGYVVITGGTIRASVRRALSPTQSDYSLYENVRKEFDNDNYKSLNGRDGVGIGGGSPGSSGTIVVLPSADVSMVEGMSANGSNTGRWDAGNCDKLFYLNKAELAVGMGGSQQATKKFTARTNDKQPHQDIYVYVPEANTFAPGVAAKVGSTSTTSTSGVDSIGVVWTNSASKVLNYYTNMTGSSAPVFFTDASVVNNGAYVQDMSVFVTGSSHNGTQNYNPAASGGTSNDVYNVIIPFNSSPNPTDYDFDISEPWNTGMPHLSPMLDENNITLDFGEAPFSNINLLVSNNLGSGPGKLDAFSKSFFIGQTSNQWLDVKAPDLPNSVTHFDLTGPVVSPPRIAEAASLPVGSKDSVTVSLKSRLPVGEHTDVLTFIADIPGGGQVVRTATLKVNITKFDATNSSTSYASMTARRPEATADPTLTNSEKVQLTAKAVMSDIDRVDTVWYLISESSTIPAVTGGGRPSAADTLADGWVRLYNNSWSYNAPLGDVYFTVPNDGKTYYIHWYIETQNSFGAHGTIRSYEVDNRKPTPILGKDGSLAVFTAPVTVKLAYKTADTTDITNPNVDRKAGDPANSMFSVTNATIVPGSIVKITDSLRYEFTLQPNGQGDVTIRMNANLVSDKFGNKNVVSNTLLLTLNNGIPQANFSSVLPVYDINSFALPVRFSVTDGLSSGAPSLKHNDGTTAIATGNAHNVFEITRISDSPTTPIPLAAGNTSYSNTNGEFTVSDPLLAQEGEYEIHIWKDSIKNDNGRGIEDTTYTFKILNLGLSPNTAHNFGLKNEGYLPMASHVATLNNNGNATASNLTIALIATNTGDTPNAFELNVSNFASTLAGHSQTSFTVRPKTGLTYDTSYPLQFGTRYAATVEIKSGAAVVATLRVTFNVTRLPAPTAIIDYENEELYNLPQDSLLRICWQGPYGEQCVDRKTSVGGRLPIPEEWMSDLVYSIAKLDNEGTVGIAFDIIIPRRPAAPLLTHEDPSRNPNGGVIYGLNDSMNYRREGGDGWIRLDTLSSLYYNKRAGILNGLSQGAYFVRYRAIPLPSSNPRFASHIAQVIIQIITPPVITREITLPELDGITFAPVAGVYRVHSQDDFAFSITFADGLEREVKTNRIIDGKQELLASTPNRSYGSYSYLLRIVQEPVTVSIGDPVANENVGESGVVWTYKGKIYIAAVDDGEAQIYTASGATVERVHLTGGMTTSVAVSRGAYIIIMSDGRAHKVIVN